MVAPKRLVSLRRAIWIPDRKDIIWIDCNPQVGQEMRDIHPFLVLSPRITKELFYEHKRFPPHSSW